MMSASALLGVMAFLIAHELIRTPNEKYSGERVALKPVFLSNKTPECSAADSYMDFLLNSEQLPYLPALILANRVEGRMSKEQARLAVLSEFDGWAKKHPDDARMMGGFLFFRYLQTDKSDLLDFRSGDNKWPIVHGWIRDSVEKIS